MSVLRSLTRLLPPHVISGIGTLQFRYPFLAPLIRWGARRIRTGETVIQYGIGKGLKFDASGGMPGYVLGTSEPEEQMALAAHLKPGDIFYDIGANIGFFSTISARLVSPHGRVYAFEPFPESATAARANARRNGFENVTVFDIAITRKSGRQQLVLGTASDVHRLSSTPEPDSPNSLVVQTHSIDELVEEGAIMPPHVVMIDVEGQELEVLAGMMRTLSSHRPIILCEVHWLGKTFTDFSDELASQLKYRVTQLNGLPVPSDPVRFHALMIPQEKTKVGA